MNKSVIIWTILVFWAMYGLLIGSYGAYLNSQNIYYGDVGFTDISEMTDEEIKIKWWKNYLYASARGDIVPSVYATESLTEDNFYRQFKRGLVTGIRNVPDWLNLLIFFPLGIVFLYTLASTFFGVGG